MGVSYAPIREMKYLCITPGILVIHPRSSLAGAASERESGEKPRRPYTGDGGSASVGRALANLLLLGQCETRSGTRSQVCVKDRKNLS